MLLLWSPAKHSQGKQFGSGMDMPVLAPEVILLSRAHLALIQSYTKLWSI